MSAEITQQQTDIEMPAPATKTAAVVDGELSPEQMEMRTKAEKELWAWNLSMCILHGVQAVAALGAGLAVTNLKS